MKLGGQPELQYKMGTAVVTVAHTEGSLLTTDQMDTVEGWSSKESVVKQPIQLQAVLFDPEAVN